MVAEGIVDKTQEVGYFARRNFMQFLGKHASLGLGGVEIGQAASAAALGTTVGLASIVGAALTQMDYRHKIHSIRSFYADEIAAKSNAADTTKLGNQEMNAVADSNKTIAEAIQKTRRQRNYGFAFSVLATMASLTAVITFTPTVLSILPVAMATGVFSEALVGGAIGLITYNLIKKPLHAIGNKLFNLDAETTHDRIVKVAKEREQGKAITREHVLEIFAGANAQLDQFIQTQYGEKCERLPAPLKQKIASDLEPMLPLSAMAMAINEGKIKVSELAFTAEGQFSGANIQKPPFVTKRTVVEYDNPTPEVPFALRFAREPQEAKARFVERLQMQTGKGEIFNLPSQ